ncbi:hypothetical protein TrLO_g8742 [Triparma laevis f. longispina]|uniref:Uncharacterized protein n=1 Tax=Triparma laevis f. longispina TaxID=1714387 RepID=A0A9W7A0T4_9STRA|nr:hypothetical protein TrLO_g8742 [Triparma laevis f. longispina]
MFTIDFKRLLVGFVMGIQLKSMTIPDSLQTLGYSVFVYCDKLGPSNIDISDFDVNTTPEAIAYLHSQQLPA